MKIFLTSFFIFLSCSQTYTLLNIVSTALIQKGMCDGESYVNP